MIGINLQPTTDGGGGGGIGINYFRDVTSCGINY